MSGFPEYDRYDGLGLAELVRAGRVTAAELAEEAIRRAEAADPELHFLVTPMFDRGRQTARGELPEGPFRGVPFLLKDLLQEHAGVRTTGGSAALHGYVPDRDAEVVRRFKEAGVVILGKTNVPEFGLLAVTEPEAFGPTRNPWDPSRTPGGSSGGSAAAVAAGVVPLAGANDGGGSIRIPASHCGLFGLKPTRGRVPSGPFYAEVWEGASVDHVLTRSVRDSAAMLDAVAGPDPGAPYTIVPPERPYLEELRRAPGRLRVGFSTRSPLGTAVHPECVEAVRRAAALLEELGHTVEEAEPQVDGLALARCYFILYFGQTAAMLDRIDEASPGAGRRAELPTRALAAIGRSLPAGTYVRSRQRWNDFARAMAAFHARHDLYLTPAVAEPPVRIGELAPRRAERLQMELVTRLRLGRLVPFLRLVDRLATDSLSRTPFTQLANLTGQPAMSVPLHWTPEGLPVGAHFVAPFGDEATLFRLAAQLEEARPWFDRRPIPTAAAASSG
ncbi:MAG TPA: amidase family protein [Longimicrobiaceae bacterium]|nr:amidase family protein [Longimicrobiaceae bacterium]